MTDIDEIQKQWQRQEAWRFRFMILATVMALVLLCKLAEHITIIIH